MIESRNWWNKGSALGAETEELSRIVATSTTVFGWREGEALTEIALVSWSLRNDATIVEIGSFMGRSSAVLAGARRMRGSGTVHCVDPFDCSGDAFSVPHYVDALKATGATSLEEVFRWNMSRLGVASWIEIHRGTARDVGTRWSSPIDLLLLDGDQSARGARQAYETWIPFLSPGGTLILGNIHDLPSKGHDGNSRLAERELKAPLYSSVRRVGSTVFATRAF